MLDLLTKSKIRKKIILLFLYHQDKEYYLSEIAQIIGTSPGTAQRELNKLIKNDLLTFKKRAGHNLYALNPKYSLLKELESIVKKTVGIEIELKTALDSIQGIVYAFLFGSYVKGGFKSDSDIDLFIIGGQEEDPIFKAIQKVEKIVGREINYHLATPQEFHKNMENKHFMKDILKNYVLIVGDKNEFRKFIK